MAILQEHYTISHDWSVSIYLGMDIDWDYARREVQLSMLSYVQDALKSFHHKYPGMPQDQPHPHVKPTYGAKVHYAAGKDKSPAVSPAKKKFIQEVTGTFLYYARAIEATMIPALGSIATQHVSPTENTMKKAKHFLDYAASHPDAIIAYQASGMVLAVHSDASYLSESKARSRAGGHFFMSNDDAIPSNNGAILNVSQIIKAVMSSDAEAELGALFISRFDREDQTYLL